MGHGTMSRISDPASRILKMAEIVWFKDITKSDVSFAGGKGANLGELLRAGLPVPNGFIISAGSYKKFLEITGIKNQISQNLSGLDVQDTDALNSASKAIKSVIMGAQIPQYLEKEITGAYSQLSSAKIRIAGMFSEGGEYVAVRSSATAEDLPNASFAGQQKTFLNVRGKQDVLNAVKECWASLFEARAIFYRAEKGFEHEKVFMSVVIQKMVDSYKSGVMFTIDPTTNDRGKIAIESAWGLGEAVVGGEVTPDFYILDKKSLRMVSKNIGEKTFMYTRDLENGKTKKVNLSQEIARKQVLTDDEIRALGTFGKRIEQHYGWPQDIEWAIEDDRIFILQTRAVTTIKGEQPPDGEQTTIIISEKTPDDIEEILERESGMKNIVIAGIERQPVPVQAAHRGIESLLEEELSAATGRETIIERPISVPKISTDGKDVLVKGFGASPGKVAGTVKIISNLEELAKVKKGDIMVTTMTTPDMVPAMERAVAIITNEGGVTAHAAIVSRELGIPCIVGTRNATQVLRDGMLIEVDGSRGFAVLTTQDVIKEIQKEAKEAKKESYEPIFTGTKVYINLGVPSKAEEYAKLPVDGIGLMREEFIFASSIGEHPLALMEKGQSQKFVDALADGIAKVASAFNPRPVILRLSDFKTNEYRSLKGGEKYEGVEQNPMIGWRGCSRYTSPQYEKAFRLELKAVKKVRDDMGLKNVWIMLPFVRLVSEVSKISKMMEEEGLKRGADLKLLIMAEVPSNIILADQFAKHIDGFSIGSNDLTQLILGVDRDSEMLANLGYFDERNDAVKRAISHLIKVAHENNVTVGICGQAPSNYPEFTEFLVECGIDSISVNADVAVKTKKLVAEMEKKMVGEEGDDLNDLK